MASETLTVGSRQTLAAAYDAVPLSLGALPALSTRTLAALLRYNPHMTLGDLLCGNAEFAAVRGIGEKGLAEIARAIASIPTDAESLLKLGITPSQSVGGESQLPSTENSGNSEDRNYTLHTLQARLAEQAAMKHQTKLVPDLPLEELRTPVPSERLSRIQAVLQAMLSEPRAGKDLWLVICYRFGLEGREQRTLDDISYALGVTRERVRQKENHALELIAHTMRRGQPRSGTMHIHPRVQADLLALNGLLEEVRPVTREDTLLEEIRDLFGCNQEGVLPDTTDIAPWRSLIALLLSALGYTHRDWLNSHLWLAMSRTEQEKLIRQIKALHHYLASRNILPCLPVEALMDVNANLSKNERISLEKLESIIRLCGTVEILADGRIQAKFEWIESRPNQVGRLLYERGEPMSLGDLAREINHRQVPNGHKKVTPQNLGNQMRGQARFIPIGRSGLWGMSCWNNITPATIVQLMEEYLITRNTPATIDDILSYISERRPAEHGSIAIYLSERPEFKRMGHNLWGLATWKSDPKLKVWDEQDVANLVADLLRERRAREVDYATVKETLARASGLTERQAQGKLNQNGRIRVRKGPHWGEYFVSLLPTSEQKPHRPHVRKKTTLMTQVTEQARIILEQAPDHEMSLEQLFYRISKVIACPKPTLYSYISKVPSIEKITDPNTRRKLCRLIG